jgi:hypothetical protein
MESKIVISLTLTFDGSTDGQRKDITRDVVSAIIHYANNVGITNPDSEAALIQVDALEKLTMFQTGSTL